MGTTVSFKCACCSYSWLLPIGGTRRGSTQSYPIYCTDCASIVKCDYNANPLLCGACGSNHVKHIDKSSMFIFQDRDRYPLFTWYGAALPSMRKVIRSRYVKPTVFRRMICRFLDLMEPQLAPHDPSVEQFWDDEPERVLHRLYPGKYYCPRCEKHEIKFKQLGIQLD